MGPSGIQCLLFKSLNASNNLGSKPLDSRSKSYGNDGDFSSCFKVLTIACPRLPAPTTASPLLHYRFTAMESLQLPGSKPAPERPKPLLSDQALVLS